MWNTILMRKHISVGVQYHPHHFRDIWDKMSKEETCKETFRNWVFALNNYSDDNITRSATQKKRRKSPTKFIRSFSPTSFHPSNFHPPELNWCCFYCFEKNSLVALLEAIYVWILSFGFVNTGFVSDFLFVCVCVQGLSHSLSSASLNQAPVPCCLHSSCVLIVHMYLCVCASVCACENV